jgi:hypothetical protein
MDNIVKLERRRIGKSVRIRCPICKRKQKMRQHVQDKIWFPISPFCCDVMRNTDTPEWNKLLDQAINDELKIVITQPTLLIPPKKRVTF